MKMIDTGTCDVCGENNVVLFEHEYDPESDGVACKVCVEWFKEQQEEKEEIEYWREQDREDEFGGGW